MQELAVRSANDFFAIDIQVEAAPTELAINAGPDTTALSVDRGSLQAGN